MDLCGVVELRERKACAEAYAAGTVINALSTGKGSAFALNIRTRVEVRESGENLLISDGKKSGSQVVEEVLNVLGIERNFEVRVESDIPRGSGLGSSSAFVNALILALCRAEGIELEPAEVLRLNAKVSLKCGISYTGAMDDAAASLLGGFVVTDNEKMELLRHDIDFNESRAIILIPNWSRKNVSLEIMRKGNLNTVRLAFELAVKGHYCEAMKLNTEYCCSLLNYSTKPVEIAEKAGLCAGLSGNGPAYVAYGNPEGMKKIIKEWSDFGRVVLTTIPKKPCFGI